MKEIWKDVIVDREQKDKYKGIYKISNLGRCKRFYKNGNQIILKPMYNNKGYIHYCLQGKAYLAHRLVMLAFDYEHYFKGADINHKDENPRNNCIDNLEWCTRKYNCNYGNHNKNIINTKKRLGIGIGKSNPAYGTHTRGIDIICLENKQVYPSAREASIQLNCDNSTIIKVCKGKKHSTHGLHFMYYSEYLENIEITNQIAKG